MLGRCSKQFHSKFKDLVKYVLKENLISNIGAYFSMRLLSGYEIQSPIRQYAAEATVPISLPEVHGFDARKIPTEVKITKADALELYENMVLIRRMETEIASLYKEKKVFGFCHLYAGTEAVGTGIVANMKPADNLITSYRCHAFAMLFQNRLKKNGPYTVMSELVGKADGISAGKGGSMHIYVPPYFYGGQGIVGGQVPLGIGLGFGHMYSDDGGVAFALYGDGASNQGQVYESFNIAALLKLPVVFVCENNLYGMGTAAKRSSSSVEYYKAGRVIPGIKSDGMDVITTREIAKVASEYSRAGNGPILLQFECYRYFGHSMSDPGTSYRTREEVQEVRQSRDPLNQLKATLADTQLATEDEIEEINKNAKKLCAEAKKAAEAAPVPDVKELYTDLYVKYLEEPRRRTCIG
ncbi:pyruvate dehydrogenase E1 component subunit alpha, mitochondrial-like isoform X1 [Cydia pomonella]|uniref:pyruvate dehydrogenase E1 component subunit alpha, mitochondrial-like isoform X1 n=2 Tax=Cydia pomonella TaxID=82600 RepID=UPI002ADE862F|nr:pyruvate dehydrogenase E1 component subunit alpha, mitochondrial-like isoform X1 [Cydia pomonella]